MIKDPSYTQSVVKGYNSEGKLQDYVSDEEYYDDVDPRNDEEDEQDE